MRPIDFIIHDGDSEPNTPVYQIAEAMMNPIIIVNGSKEEWKAVSYYYDGEARSMVLDITPLKSWSGECK